MARCFGSLFAIGGHRGFGENLLRKVPGQPTICPGARENTIASFRRACKHEADFVEFDVQVTSDGVPVIFHDDYLVHGNLCTPKRSLVSQLSLHSFKTAGPLMRWFKDAATRTLVPCDQAWACEEEDELPTFEELLRTIPAHVGLNVEIKLATSAALVETPLDEVQRVVDPIVQVLASAASGHNIVVSSFDPDVMAYFQTQLPCLQDSYPSLTCWYLSAGANEALRQDPRRQSLQAAVAFAAQQRLTGIVLDAAQLQREPETVQAARAAGLLVMSYGLANDDLAWVQRQRDLGVAGVIADDVAAVVASASWEKCGGSVCTDASPRSDMDTVVVPRLHEAVV